jgi:hypothetical protein
MAARFVSTNESTIRLLETIHLLETKSRSKMHENKQKTLPVKTENDLE